MSGFVDDEGKAESEKAESGNKFLSHLLVERTPFFALSPRALWGIIVPNLNSMARNICALKERPYVSKTIEHASQ